MTMLLTLMGEDRSGSVELMGRRKKRSMRKHVAKKLRKAVSIPDPRVPTPEPENTPDNAPVSQVTEPQEEQATSIVTDIPANEPEEDPEPVEGMAGVPGIVFVAGGFLTALFVMNKGKKLW